MHKSSIRAATIVTALAIVGPGVATQPLAASASTPPVYQFWDQYPQYNASSTWAKLVESCGVQAGVTIDRTTSDTTALLSKALLAAEQHHSPDVIIIDNATAATLAQAGALVPNSQSGLSTTGVLPSLL